MSTKALLTMLEMQDQMNSRVHPQWQEQGYEWYRAIWVECAEMLDHYGWKWWKHQQPDLPQVQMELIDIWHFGMSLMLQEGESPQSIAERLAPVLTSGEGGDFKELLETFTTVAISDRGFDALTFADLMVASELSFDGLVRSYIGKNVLNFFRQDHGYKEGTYHKHWQGREDNEHLVEVLETIDIGADDVRDQVYQGLKARYPQ